MAQVAEYEVIHGQVRHDGHAYGAGRVLRLTTTDGSRLVALGSVRPRANAVPVEIDVVDGVTEDEAAKHAAFFEGIGKLTKAQLATFALDSYQLTLTGTKEEMVAQLLNARENAANGDPAAS